MLVAVKALDHTEFFFFIQTGSWVNPVSHPIGTRLLSSEVKSQGGMKLTIHFLLMPRSRIHGAIPSLPHTSASRTTLFFALKIYLDTQYT
jgi:hypothetical protein